MTDREDWSHDLELTRLAREGDRAAVEKFLERLRVIPRVLAKRNARIGRPFQPGEIDDLAQEVFARVWKRLDEYRGEAALETWVYRFCCWTMLDALRQRRPHTPLSGIDEEPQTEEEAEALDDVILLAAVADLPADQSQVVTLKQLEGLSFPEIGERLDLSPNTVKTRYYRALERLRTQLAPRFGEDPS